MANKETNIPLGPIVLRPTLWVFLFVLFVPLSSFFFCLLLGLLITSSQNSTLVEIFSVSFGLIVFLWSGIQAYVFSIRRFYKGVLDRGTGRIELKTLPGKTVRFNVQDLLGYSACRTPTLWTRLPEDGIVLYLKSADIIELSDASMMSVHQLVDYLTAHQIPFLGEERSWYPLRKKRYKFAK